MRGQLALGFGTGGAGVFLGMMVGFGGRVRDRMRMAVGGFVPVRVGVMGVVMTVGVTVLMTVGMVMVVRVGMRVLVGMLVTVVALINCAYCRTGVGEHLVHDLLDGPGAATALPAAAKATIDFTSGKGVFRSQNGTADFIVAEDIARTHNHKVTLFPRVSGWRVLVRPICKLDARCKRKSRFFKLFQSAGGVLILLKVGSAA